MLPDTVHSDTHPLQLTEFEVQTKGISGHKMGKGTYQGQQELALAFLQGTRYEGMIVTGRSSGRKKRPNYCILLKSHPNPRHTEMSQVWSRTQEHGTGIRYLSLVRGGR